ncbi:HVA22-LIKE PROTEINS [Salix viminalis]|uniref:HVA22-like protein n=1 Tax=Salix viminalis TaxID=40686 RepID=A0A9Q0P9I9_SALVM|nr:HVA22-LIKE PROTEINS [Salix viminalis]
MSEFVMGFVFLLKLAVKCLGILAWPVFGLGYPFVSLLSLWASVQAIETNSNSETQKLITYWVSISVVLILEHSFQLEWLAFWSYIKLMIVCCLVLPCFDGSVYVYKHLVNLCLPMNPTIITCQINKKDDFLVEVKRYMKDNGSDALEDLIASTACQVESNTSQTEYITFLPQESMHSATTIVGGGDLRGFLPPEEVQKEWTCVICQVTVPNETVLHLHLHGNRHKANCERLNIKNQTDVNSHLQGSTHRKAFEPLNFKNQEPNSNVSAASAGRNQCQSRYIEIMGSQWWCTICNSGSVSGMQSHLRGKRHRANLRALDGH